MKKKLIYIILISFISIMPLNTHAKTLQDLQSEVDKYTSDLQEKQAKLVKNKEEVQAVKNNIAKIETEISNTEKEISNLQQEINKCNEEIKKKTEEIKKIVAYYQIENGDNAYLEYAFGAETIQDMIYRVSITEQLAEYNNKVMKELQELIKQNVAKKAEMQIKKENLNTLKANLKEEQSKLEIEGRKIADSMPSVEEQIKAAKANVTYYKNLGCGQNEDINVCQNRIFRSRGGLLPSNGAFLRPLTSGTRRGCIGSYGGHIGCDIEANGDGTIYSIGDGYVIRVTKDNCSKSWCNYTCSGNANIVAVKYLAPNGKNIYVEYVHMSSVSVSEGQTVTKYTKIGYIGHTGCTSGHEEGGVYTHLHLEISACSWYPGGGCTYNDYLNNILNPLDYVSLGGNGSSWSTR